VIRPAAPDDVPAILDLVRLLAAYEREPDAVVATEASVSDALFAPSPAVFAAVAVDEPTGEVVGLALWFLSFSTWEGRHGMWLEDLVVRDEHRGRGHGVALLAHLAAICVERGYPRLEWAVLGWNEPALGFYAALGATTPGEWRGHRLAGPALAALATRAQGTTAGES
jgi:GNAT superfamily N-acetyltransferase